MKNISDLKTVPFVEKSLDEIKVLHPDINLLLITANEIETFHVRRELKPLHGCPEVIKVPHNLQTYFVGTFGEYKAVHVQLGKMGSLSDSGAILTAADAMSSWTTKAVVMIGVAMGIDDEKQSIGDVLVSETIISYESQRIGKKLIFRGSIVESGSMLFNRFKNVSGWCSHIGDNKIARLLHGPILSGEKLIDNLKSRNRILKNFPHSIGAEMEGAGIYASCKNKGIHEWIIVKGICDYGDGDKNVEKEARQNLAALSATSLCLAVFKSRIGFTSIGLYPKEVFNDEDLVDKEIIANRIEEEIVALVELDYNNKIMHSAVQTTVSAFLELTSYQKAIVIKVVKLPISNLTNFNAHDMDKAFFQHVKDHNLLPQLWNAINDIVPFDNKNNPFI